MTANVTNHGFLARLHARAKRILEAIGPCFKKPETDEDAPENDIEVSSMTSTSEGSNLNQSAAKDREDTNSEHSELSDETHIRYRSDDSSDGRGQAYLDDSSFVESTADDSHLAVQPFNGTDFSDTEEISRGPFYEPLVLTDIFFENDLVYVHLAEFFVFALNGNITMNVAIYLNACEQ
ncbi:Hypothetical predicted protein [Octopus vulgaris]|uniref:Uncharacterized protein n=1 Tax=Octopus vulgaris TaxID=6645 RepID=A0AA36BXN2_OCTVU|nr:Hypothetical predicted protein [Octopus vulgaris]